MANSSSWVCENCTLDNGNDQSICEVCEHPRPKNCTLNNGDGQIGNNRKIDTWTCDNCTLTNPVSATICETCSQPRESRNDAVTSNAPVASSTVQTTYVWEWKGGGDWHEYPDDISAKIDKAYFKGTLKFDVELARGDYQIDLTKLVQISKDTRKERKIQRVKWEYDPTKDDSEDEESKMDIDTSVTPSKPSNDGEASLFAPDDNSASKKNGIHPKQEVTDSLPSKDDKLSNLSSDPESDVDTKMKKLKVENKPLKRSKKRKNTSPVAKPAKKRKKGDTLLSVFDTEKNEDPPAALTSLKKRKKRKLSDVVADDEDESTSHSPIKPPAKKRKSNDASPIKISKKYSEKQATGQSGAELNKTLIDALWELSMIERNAGNRFKVCTDCIHLFIYIDE